MAKISIKELENMMEDQIFHINPDGSIEKKSDEEISNTFIDSLKNSEIRENSTY